MGIAKWVKDTFGRYSKVPDILKDDIRYIESQLNDTEKEEIKNSTRRKLIEKAHRFGKRIHKRSNGKFVPYSRNYMLSHGLNTDGDIMDMLMVFYWCFIETHGLLTEDVLDLEWGYFDEYGFRGYEEVSILGLTNSDVDAMVEEIEQGTVIDVDAEVAEVSEVAEVPSVTAEVETDAEIEDLEAAEEAVPVTSGQYGNEDKWFKDTPNYEAPHYLEAENCHSSSDRYESDCGGGCDDCDCDSGD